MILYADDWDLVAYGTQFDSSIIAAILLLRALGVPLSWAKIRGGFTYTWLGLELNRADWSLGAFRAPCPMAARLARDGS